MWIIARHLGFNSNPGELVFNFTKLGNICLGQIQFNSTRSVLRAVLMRLLKRSTSS